VRVQADLAALRDHAAHSWPPAVARRADGWLLRSTPELDRGRLKSALPRRADPDLAPVLDFHAALGRPAQVQLAPIARHPRPVERRNEPAVALYRSLGFTVACDYVHRVAP
jgi:hypothetical protein